MEERDFVTFRRPGRAWPGLPQDRSAFQGIGAAPWAASMVFAVAKGRAALNSSRVNWPGNGARTTQARLAPETAEARSAGAPLPRKMKAVGVPRASAAAQMRRIAAGRSRGGGARLPRLWGYLDSSRPGQAPHMAHGRRHTAQTT